MRKPPSTRLFVEYLVILVASRVALAYKIVSLTVIYFSSVFVVFWAMKSVLIIY